MNIPEEAIEAADRAAFPGLPAGMSAEEARRRVTRAVEAAAPFVAADQLREVERSLSEVVKELRASGLNPDYIQGMEDAGGGIRLALDGIEAMLKGRT